MKYFIALILSRLLDTIFLQKYLPGVPILFYHAIGDNQSKLFVNPAAFEGQMRWLAKHGYRSILPSELAPASPRDKVFLITFDDGFKSVRDVAFPILQKYGFRATVFIATDYIGQKSGYARTESDREFSLMTADDIKDLLAANWCLANHGASHQDLTALPPEAVSREYSRALDALKNLGLDRHKHIVAYPFNRYNTTVVNNLRAQGAIMAFNGGSRLYTKIENPLAVPRFEINNNFSRFSLVFSPSLHRLKSVFYPYVRAEKN